MAESTKGTETIESSDGWARAAASMLAAGRGHAKRDCYDVIIVGAGVIGAATARQLARYDLSIAVIEAGLDVACGATRANSGIVHAGFDPLPGTLKAKYNVAGAAMFPQWQRELGFAYYPNGALVVAFDEAERAMLQELLERAVANGVDGCVLVEHDELLAMEPNLAPNALCALFAPTSGVCDPYGLTYGAAENAAENGVEFLFDRRVTGITRLSSAADEACGSDAACGSDEAAKPDGAYDGLFEIRINDGQDTAEVVRARSVVNCAGVHADEINNLISRRTIAITPRKGEYLLYHNKLGGTFHRTMFRAPRNDSSGKGVLVAQVVFGNPFIGPNAEEIADKDDVSTTAKGQAYVLEQARRIWPDASAQDVIATYAGIRASDANGAGDFIIGEAPDVPGFFNAACIDSPGLASAPAIATDLATMVAERLGAAERSDFNPQRMPAPLLVMMPPEAVEQLVAANPAYGVQVCACCHVSEGELVDTLHRALPVLSLDAMKWRTGATMGPCHGGRCTARLVEIAARELGIAADSVQKRLQGSAMLAADACGSVSADLIEAARNLAADLRAELDAKGLREIGSGSLGMVGTRPAGVYSALQAIGLLGVAGCVPGTAAVVWGTHDVAQMAVSVLAEAGVRIVRVIDPDDGAVVEVHGAHRVERVTIVAGGAREDIPCDMLIASPRLVEDE